MKYALLIFIFLTSAVHADWWTSAKKKISNSYRSSIKKHTIIAYHTHKTRDGYVYGHSHQFTYWGKLKPEDVNTDQHLNSMEHLNAVAMSTERDRLLQSHNEKYIHVYEHNASQNNSTNNIKTNDSIETKIINGHEYIVVKSNNNTSIVHSESCPCKKKRSAK